MEGVDVGPELSVVVSSHDRPYRLRRLLDALAGQTLNQGRWEIVVAHDSRGEETQELLRSHALAEAGTLRHVTFPADSVWVAEKRNAGWRAARGELIAFTDDDCRPPADWLERLLDACRANPGAIVQGTTRPDPEEAHKLDRPWDHSQVLDPPTPWAEMCNIAYPRSLLDGLGGLAEDLATGEDTDLAWRGMAAGAPYVPAAPALTYHCVEPVSLWRAVRGATRWHDVPEMPRRHPDIRRHYSMRVFWRPNHMWLALALPGLALARRSRLALLLCLPYVIVATPGKGHDARARLRALAELGGMAAIELSEMAVLARASLKHRSFLL